MACTGDQSQLAIYLEVAASVDLLHHALHRDVAAHGSGDQGQYGRHALALHVAGWLLWERGCCPDDGLNCEPGVERGGGRRHALPLLATSRRLRT
jgi:hypothetical protein